MSFEQILGHDRPVRVVRRALATGRVPHAYLFWGPDGVGKERVAAELGAALLCLDTGALSRGEACGACGACRKVAAGSHPDLHLLAPRGASLPISEVRGLQESLSYQAFERGRKVAIIRDAYRLTREAANALLKTLEEPPAGTHIVLLAHHRNQLLPTLVSRCQSLRFDPIPEDAVRRLLEAGGMGEAAAETLARAAGGCPGAVWGQDPEALAAMGEEAAQAWAYLGQGGAADRLAFAARWAADREELPRRLDALERALVARMREAGRDGRSEGGVLSALGALGRVRGLIEHNVNAELALDAFFLGALERPWEDHL
jgi:DNA polymerase-3 subunit delta'